MLCWFVPCYWWFDSERSVCGFVVCLVVALFVGLLFVVVLF